MANSVASSLQEKSSITDATTTKDNAKDTTTNTKDKASAKKADADKSGPEANLTKEEKLKRFENEGIEFKAKLIGSELVMEPRGDKMCQSSIQRLKAMIKGLKSHKKRILLKISYNGVKVYDEKTNEILHHHEVPQISYIASDDTDTRTFGYVCDLPNKGHQFICFKTGGPAITVMSTISSLFEAVLEKKNEADEEQKRHKEKLVEQSPLANLKQTSHQSIDLVGDSGIMDGDLSFSSDINFSKQQAQNQQQQQQQQQQAGPMFADSILSSGYTDSSFNNSSAWPSVISPAGSTATPVQQQHQSNQSQLSQLQQQLNQQSAQQAQQQLYQKDQYQSQQQQLQQLYQQQHQHNQQQQQQMMQQQQQHHSQPQHQQQQQSTAASADLLFSDLFFGLSDPIIVSNNDSLVSSKMPLDGAGSSIGAGAGMGGAPGSGQQQISQQQMMLQQQQRMLNNSQSSQNQASITSNPFDFNNSGASNIMRPRPTPSMQAPQPIPPRAGFNRQSTLNVPIHNRSLVHNHSSVSLSDAALTRQFSFNTTSPSNQQPISESYADRYSVFNDIDNLPSIFESTSLGNVNSTHQGVQRR